MTKVLEATEDSDHLPILTEIPLEAINFMPPGPEVPPQDKAARLKVPLTQQQKLDYKTLTELKVGQDARQLTSDINKIISRADAHFAADADTHHLHRNKKEQLENIGITPQQVIDYANRMTGLMTQAVAVAKETLEWTQAGPVQTFRFRTRQENRLNDQLISYRIALR